MWRSTSCPPERPPSIQKALIYFQHNVSSVPIYLFLFYSCVYSSKIAIGRALSAIYSFTISHPSLNILRTPTSTDPSRATFLMQYLTRSTRVVPASVSRVNTDPSSFSSCIVWTTSCTYYIIIVSVHCRSVICQSPRLRRYTWHPAINKLANIYQNGKVMSARLALSNVKDSCLLTVLRPHQFGLKCLSYKSRL